MDALKNAAISARILEQVNAGKTLPEACDAVMGAGAYKKLAGELYDEIRAKHAA